MVGEEIYARYYNKKKAPFGCASFKGKWYLAKVHKLPSSNPHTHTHPPHEAPPHPLMRLLPSPSA